MLDVTYFTKFNVLHYHYRSGSRHVSTGSTTAGYGTTASSPSPSVTYVCVSTSQNSATAPLGGLSTVGVWLLWNSLILIRWFPLDERLPGLLACWQMFAGTRDLPSYVTVLFWCDGSLMQREIELNFYRLSSQSRSHERSLSQEITWSIYMLTNHSHISIFASLPTTMFP